MDEFHQIAGWLAFLVVAAIVAYVFDRCRRRRLCIFTLFSMLGSAVGFVGALLVDAVNWHVWLTFEQRVSASLRQFSGAWFSVGTQYAPLIGAAVGAILAVVLAYAFRHKIAA